MVFQHVIEHIHDGLLTIDSSGNITTLNPAAEAILEMEKYKVLDKKFSDVFLNYPENDDFNQIILDAVYDSTLTHHKICNYFTGEHLKSLFVTTSFLKVETEGKLQSVGITVLFSDVTDIQELRDAVQALEKIKALNQHLEKLSYLDELTELPNRRFYNDVCNREWHKAVLEQERLGLIMIDIDYFKEINDSLGHQAGDACLKAVAKALSGSLNGASDVVARYGGDEFIAIVPNSNVATLHKKAEKFRRAVLSLNTENAGSPFGTLTVSIGIASKQALPESHPKELFRAADEALYRAKQKGRNQISD